VPESIHSTPNRRFAPRCAIGFPSLLMPAALLLAGCFPPLPAKPQVEDDALVQRVRVALAGHENAAATYAGLYAVLAERLESDAYATTNEAAEVAGRAADILNVPGVLEDVVSDELDPLLGTPGPLTPDMRTNAARRLRALSDACREVSP
jgi:hypothetical protein